MIAGGNISVCKNQAYTRVVAISRGKGKKWLNAEHIRMVTEVKHCRDEQTDRPKRAWKGKCIIPTKIIVLIMCVTYTLRSRTHVTLRQPKPKVAATKDLDTVSHTRFCTTGKVVNAVNKNRRALLYLKRPLLKTHSPLV